MAAQLMTRNGLSARRLCWYSARATNSLPVPLSPRISTLTSCGAMRPIILHISCMTGLRPMMRSTRSSVGSTAGTCIIRAAS